MKNEEEDEDDSKNTIYIMQTLRYIKKSIQMASAESARFNLQLNSKENTDPKLSVVMTTLAIDLNEEKEEEQDQ